MIFLFVPGVGYEKGQAFQVWKDIKKGVKVVVALPLPDFL